MGNKKRSKQSKSSGTSSSHTKRATEEPKEEESSVQTKSTNEERRKRIEIVERQLQEKQRKWNRDDDCTLVSSYWNSMSVDLKKEFLMIRVSDLKSHFSKDTWLKDFLAEALSYAESNKSWKVWFCWNCTKEFSDSESHKQHVVQGHVGSLLPEMQRMVPQIVGNDWIEMMRSCSWKPLDAIAAVKMLEDQANHKEEDGVERPTACSFPDGWPVSDDSERAKILEEIYEAFKMLIRYKYLSTNHLNRFIQFTKDMIQGPATGSQLLVQHLDQSPTCICILEAPQLNKIIEVLVEMLLVCGLDEEKINKQLDGLHNSNNIPEIEQKIVMSEDASCLLLDECLVPVEITPGATDCAAKDDVVLQNTDPFLSWILSVSSRDQLTLEDKRHEGLKLVDTLKKDFDLQQKLSEEKTELINSEEAMQLVHDFCLEGKKREHFTESVLRKRKEELIKTENDVMSVRNRFELDAITNVLQAADEMKFNQPGSSLDLESKRDSHIETAIQELKENIFKELCVIDVEMRGMVLKMQQSELKLEPVSGFDYRALLLSLVKMYLRACLEELAMKDANKKSDAAAEALLAEVALEDSKKDDVKAESDKKSKDKKRKKGKSKTQNLKATNGQEQPIGETISVRGCDDVKDHADPIPVCTISEEEQFREIQFKEDERKLDEMLGLQRKLEEGSVHDDDDDDSERLDLEEDELRQGKIMSLDLEIAKVQEELRRHEEEAAKLKERVRELLDFKRQLEYEAKMKQIARGKRKAEDHNPQ